MTIAIVGIVIGATAVVEGALALVLVLQVRRDMKRRDAKPSPPCFAETARLAIRMFREYRSVNDPLGTEDEAEKAVIEQFEYADRLGRGTP